MNKLAYLLLLTSLLSGLNLFAQDVIYLKDGTKVDGKISLVGQDNITYKKADNLTGPDYEMKRGEVLMIVYENGSHEIINAPSKTKGVDQRATDFGRHMVTWEFMDLLSINMSMSYEYFTKSGYLGLRVPLSMGFDQNAYTYGDIPEVFGTRGRVWASGFDLNYYPTGQGTLKYFIGPSLGIGSNRYESYYDDYYAEPYYAADDTSYMYPMYDYNYDYQTGLATRVSLHINNGWIAQPTKNFNISGAMGLGLSTRFFKGENMGYTPSVTLRLSAGYRF